MYVLIDPKHKALDGRYHEKLPDGRVILSMGDAKAMGSLHNVDIIATGRELDEIIEAQKNAGVVPPVETIDPGMNVVPQTETSPADKRPADQTVTDNVTQGNDATQQQATDTGANTQDTNKEGGLV